MLLAHNPVLLTESRDGTTNLFLEYEHIGTNRALLFPCTDEGEIDYLIMSTKSQGLWWRITNHPKQWIQKNIVHLIVPPQPAIVGCGCGKLVHIPNELSFDATCNHCGAYYTIESALILPKAEKE